MRLRARVRTGIPGYLSEALRKAMLEDSELYGRTAYYGDPIVADLEVECGKRSTCFASFEDRLRCLSVAEETYGSLRKIVLDGKQNKRANNEEREHSREV